MNENTENVRQYPELVISNTRFYPASKNGNTLAYVTVELNGVFVLHDLRIVQGKNGLFVAMSQKEIKGEYKDMCHPSTREYRGKFCGEILDRYEEYLERGNADAD